MKTQAVARRYMAPVSSLILGLLFCVLMVQPVQAAFPGLNGRILFQSGRDGDLEIFTMHMDGTDIRQLTNNSFAESNPSWSADGTKILFNSNRDGNHEIYIMNHDGTNQQRLTNNSTTDRLPSFSPDGSKIVFTSNRDGNDEIYIMDADGGNQTPLTNDPGADSHASFSPDGSRVLFASYRDGTSKVYVMNPDGSNVELVFDSLSLEPSWHPSMAKIIFQGGSAAPNTREIISTDSDGGGQVALTANAFLDGTATFSPDGEKVTFFSNRDGNDEIYIMEADGANTVRLTSDVELDRVPSIQPLTISPSIIDAATSLAVTEGRAIYNAPSNHTDTYQAIDPTSVAVTVQPQKGVSVVDPVTGFITYTPDKDAAGLDSLTYRICSTAHEELCVTSSIEFVLGEATLVETGSSVLTTALPSSLILLISTRIIRRQKKYKLR